MIRILISVMTIAVVGATAVGATNAVFTSQATVQNNTFSSGVLEVKVNGQSTLPGITFGNAAPGDCVRGQFAVNNLGHDETSSNNWAGGRSTLSAKSLKISAIKGEGSNAQLYDKLNVKIGTNRNLPTPVTVFDGKLKNLTSGDLLAPNWTELNPGQSQAVSYEACLPVDADNTYQGLSAKFDFLIEATNP